ncbi:MAG: ISKra4 family transposase, partial [Psychromonas sp.]
MNLAYLNTPDFSFFSDANKQLERMIDQLQSDNCRDNEHGDIEQYIQKEGFEVLRCLFQGYLDLKAASEKTLSNVYNAEGIHLSHTKHATTRKLTTLFGDVIVKRKSYSQRSQKSVFPLDTQLNLPSDQYSDGIRHRVAIEARKSSYDETVESINQTTGGYIQKRQSLQLAQDVAQDFDKYYLQNRYLNTEQTDNLLVLTFDGKGIVMRPEGLREYTKKAALKSKKLNSRLSAGEKKDRKRMAQVAAVYTALPHVRTPESIMKIETEDNNVQFLK